MIKRCSYIYIYLSLSLDAALETDIDVGSYAKTLLDSYTNGSRVYTSVPFFSKIVYFCLHHSSIDAHIHTRMKLKNIAVIIHQFDNKWSNIQ